MTVGETVYLSILEVLRASDKPMSAAEIAKQVTKYHLMTKEVSGKLRTLEAEGKVRHIYVKNLNKNIWEAVQ